MKERLFIFGALILFLIIMIGLNALSYVQKIKEPDSEFAPVRSTYHPGATGLLAYYTLLSETGRPVSRWQFPISTLATESNGGPATFILAGPQRREISEDDRTKLKEWVAMGGTLILIDREPIKEFLDPGIAWSVSVSPKIAIELMTTDPADQLQMTKDTPAAMPDQPTLVLAAVNAVQPSRFASAIEIQRSAEESNVRFFNASQSEEVEDHYDDGSEYEDEDADEYYKEEETYTAEPYDFYSGQPVTSQSPGATNGTDDAPMPSPPPPAPKSDTTITEVPEIRAPIVHLSDSNRNLLVEVPYGAGKIFLLGDPFIVSNGGISMADNAQLGINLAGAGGGPVAFDEYHQGYSSDNNRVFEYFQGTPVIAILLQLFALSALVLVSRSRRFARPVPEPEPTRLSKLEYVSAMAELQQRTRAFDLAMENIYLDFRRRVTRQLGGANQTAKRQELAAMISERIGSDVNEIDQLLFKCEDIVRGEPTNRKEMIDLTARLRDLEDRLGLTRKANPGV